MGVVGHHHGISRFGGSQEPLLLRWTTMDCHVLLLKAELFGCAAERRIATTIDSDSQAPARHGFMFGIVKKLGTPQ